MTETPVPANAPSRGHDVLGDIEDSLAVRLRDTEQRERDLIVADRLVSSDFPAAVQQFLERLDERMCSLGATAEQASRAGAEIEAELADREEALRQWASEFARARDRLAEAMRTSLS